MKAKLKLYITDDNGDQVFGQGPLMLLEGVEKHGSLSAAARESGISYSKALRIIKKAEGSLGFSLTKKVSGGKGGGGSALTAQAADFLQRYKKLQEKAESFVSQEFARDILD
ncbi:LysR family transcriptional regulator [Clostridiaceae bacterium OttesenSCG-928-D20]|nr:LysR family transcriptional regulator [Clostridiaceae bacterium OttesenSCG-928-D20]